MKIILEDTRHIPDSLSDYAIARRYETMIMYLDLYKNELETVSLDYDLGSEKTGLDVLHYMHLHHIYPKNINIHSTHIHGEPQMVEYAKENFPDAAITTNKID